MPASNYYTETGMKVFILGSCVSRDAFDRGDGAEFQLVHHVGRSSIASIFAGSPFPDTFSERLSSKFQRGMVRMDILKQSRYHLRTAEADIVLMDLIDERFNLLETSSWRFCTVSTELDKTGAPTEVADGYAISSGSVRFMHYWNEGWRSLVELLKSRAMLDRVRVNIVFWRHSTISGAPFANVSSSAIDAANATLERMYARMAQDLEPGQFFRYGDVMQCPDKHEWKPAPFHYSEEFNQEVLSNLRRERAELMPQTAPQCA
jgi:hypothetical protein